ncbi:M16 family metallopeptidase [Odoribacter lunatus]|uniref:M16 family metallopeptidase n=1 Tax=Odoribacter lunatus TaxID=2941335 RepID=UPI00203C1FD4|nr:pitrilysin family protein [Odoribacter lunatus]
MKKLLFILSCCLPYLLQANSGKIDFVEYKLDNGLHVILQEDHTTPNIVVSVMYHVGSKNEKPELTGFAHFFEHLMFEGTKNIKRHEFDKYVTRVGGNLNANTFFDRTYYYELLPSNELELGLWLESERMLHPTIEAIGIKTQKDVVCQEMGQTRDNRPYGRLLTETLKRAYTTHPYKHDVLGSEEHIRNASDQDFIDFHNKFYVPNNAVLTIVGDFNIAEAKKLVHDYFNDIPAGEPVVQPTIQEPAKTQEVRDTTYDNIQMPALIMAYHIPGMTSDDFYAVSMLNTLLAQGQSSRLYSTIVNDKQMAMELAAIPLPLEHPGLSIILGLPNMNVQLSDLESEINKEVERLQQEPISDREFQKLQNQIENQLVNSNSMIEARAMNLASAYTYYNNTNQVNEELEKYRSITKADLQNAAKKYFNKENRVVLYYLPNKK